MRSTVGDRQAVQLHVFLEESLAALFLVLVGVLAQFQANAVNDIVHNQSPDVTTTPLLPAQCRR